MLYERIFRAFHDHGLDYAVIGGIAVNLHGYMRATGDLDIIIIISGRVMMKAGDVDIPVASINDLIELKKAAGRERDLIDIKVLRKIQEVEDN